MDEMLMDDLARKRREEEVESDLEGGGQDGTGGARVLRVVGGRNVISEMLQLELLLEEEEDGRAQRLRW